MRLGMLTDEEADLPHRLPAAARHGLPAAGRAGCERPRRDQPVSFLVLEAAHRLRIPANVGVCVGKDVPIRLLQRGVEILFEDKSGMPKFLGIDQTTAGFMRNGIPAGDRRASAPIPAATGRPFRAASTP